MKKLITIISFLLILFSFGCSNNYKEEKEALKQNVWYFDADDNKLCQLSFNDEGALFTIAEFNGNGKSILEENVYSFKFDNSSLLILDNGEIIKTINYSFDGTNISFEDKTILTLEEIDKQLQGKWTYNDSVFSSELEYNAVIQDGTFTYEHANEAFGTNDGSFYYFGPYSGDYTLSFGCFDSAMKGADEWFFTIVEKNVVLLHYDNPLKEGAGLKGENGYSFY